MDRSWTNECRIWEEYESGVSKFLQYFQEDTIFVNKTYFCPCVHCLNQTHQYLGNMRAHLLIFGIMRSYTVCTWHGEMLHKSTTSQGINYVKEWMSCYLEDMIRHFCEENFGRAHLYDSLKFNSEEELYPACSNSTRLSATLKLFSLKTKNE
ncbi:hypothetical protein V8G54_019893 [Vigna mungo]|uniref:Transposase-associated domain-containing protein n=1 Tax=Vigna mungo TaxID=3915 RepID=A0AAQ3NCK9_VIGMU